MRSEESKERRRVLDEETMTEAENESSEVPEGTRFLTIFLWVLIQNIIVHLVALKFVVPTTVYLKPN